MESQRVKPEPTRSSVVQCLLSLHLLYCLQVSQSRKGPRWRNLQNEQSIRLGFFFNLLNNFPFSRSRLPYLRGDWE